MCIYYSIDQMVYRTFTKQNLKKITGSIDVTYRLSYQLILSQYLSALDKLLT